MKAELINVGRNKVNKTIEVKNIKGIFKELDQHLRSKDVELIEADEDSTTYNVEVGGFRFVGKVKITKA